MAKSTRKTQSVQESGNDLFGQLVKQLTQDESGAIRGYGNYLRNPDPVRSSLLTAHIIVERMIESVLETRLPFPEFWITTADFNSKVRLARSLGVINEDEHRVCSVLNAARNALAHKLDPLPIKWRRELERLAFGRKKKSSDEQHTFQKILLELVAIVGARYKRILFYHKRFQLREQHHERWGELMKQKLYESLESDIDLDDGLVQLQIDLQIARESKQHQKKKNEKSAKSGLKS